MRDVLKKYVSQLSASKRLRFYTEWLGSGLITREDVRWIEGIEPTKPPCFTVMGESGPVEIAFDPTTNVVLIDGVRCTAGALQRLFVNPDPSLLLSVRRRGEEIRVTVEGKVTVQ